MYAGTGPGLTEFYSLLMKKVSFKVMDLSYWISISVPRDLTSLSLLGSLSLQRIFSSFVYTEKTSNGETEVQQVSNKSSLCRACVRVCACAFLAMRGVPVRAMDGACHVQSWAQQRWTHAPAIRGKRGCIKILWLLSHWLWSSLPVFPLVCAPSLIPPPLCLPISLCSQCEHIAFSQTE